MTQQKDRRLWPAMLIASLLACLAQPATAIIIDPGDEGTSFRDRTFGFDDANGTRLAGQALSLDFVFADAKHLVPVFGPPGTGISFYNVGVTLFHDLGAVPGVATSSSGALGNEQGAPLAAAQSETLGQSAAALFYTMGIGEDVADGLIHQQVNIELRLPVADATITGGELRFRITSSGGEIRVGSSVSVAEPSTAAVLSLALLIAAGSASARNSRRSNSRVR